jgi:radical SAM protein with 4Fe4S-binding SPASM domain
LSNSAAIIAAKKALGRRNPFMEFKFILFEHNRHQFDEAARLSRQMGFDKFSVVLDNASAVTTETMERARSSNLAKKRACFWPWSSAVIRWDGTVWPCCTSRVEMGNIYKTPFKEIWNNERYRNLRSFFATHHCDEVTKNCLKCMRF